MKSTTVDTAGNVRCPHCGAVNSFTVKRTTAAKVIGIPTIGVGTLLAPKRLRCNGCGHNLRAIGQHRNVSPHGATCVCKSCCDQRLGVV